MALHGEKNFSDVTKIGRLLWVVWVFFGRNDAKAETSVFCPPHAKSWLTGKDSDARRDWGQEEKGMTEDEMAGWHHQLDGRESDWTLGVGDGQGGLACCDSWDCKESDTTEWQNWTDGLSSCNKCNQKGRYERELWGSEVKWCSLWTTWLVTDSFEDGRRLWA